MNSFCQGTGMSFFQEGVAGQDLVPLPFKLGGDILLQGKPGAVSLFLPGGPGRKDIPHPPAVLPHREEKPRRRILRLILHQAVLPDLPEDTLHPLFILTGKIAVHQFRREKGMKGPGVEEEVGENRFSVEDGFSLPFHEIEILPFLEEKSLQMVDESPFEDGFRETLPLGDPRKAWTWGSEAKSSG